MVLYIFRPNDTCIMQVTLICMTYCASIFFFSLLLGQRRTGSIDYVLRKVGRLGTPVDSNTTTTVYNNTSRQILLHLLPHFDLQLCKNERWLDYDVLRTPYQGQVAREMLVLHSLISRRNIESPASQPLRSSSTSYYVSYHVLSRPLMSN